MVGRESSVPCSCVRAHPSRARSAGDAGRNDVLLSTDGIHSALEQARAAAGAKDVALGGGADVGQEYLKAGLIDEMEIHIVPLMLADGARLFENTDGRQTEYDCVRVICSPAVAHFKYRRMG